MRGRHRPAKPRQPSSEPRSPRSDGLLGCWLLGVVVIAAVALAWYTDRV
ncbi:hypothetical protein OG216_47690 (plasmid) [Streptomycetaceae bacterium NBC_01309]